MLGIIVQAPSPLGEGWDGGIQKAISFYPLSLTTNIEKYIFSIETILLGDHSKLDPPDPMPNSEVKRFSADDSVALFM